MMSPLTVSTKLLRSRMDPDWSSNRNPLSVVVPVSRGELGTPGIHTESPAVGTTFWNQFVGSVHALLPSFPSHERIGVFGTTIDERNRGMVEGVEAKTEHECALVRSIV